MAFLFGQSEHARFFGACRHCHLDAYKLAKKPVMRFRTHTLTTHTHAHTRTLKMVPISILIQSLSLNHFPRPPSCLISALNA